jgi:hypothetical protein
MLATTDKHKKKMTLIIFSFELSFLEELYSVIQYYSGSKYKVCVYLYPQLGKGGRVKLGRVAVALHVGVGARGGGRGHSRWQGARSFARTRTAASRFARRYY